MISPVSLSNSSTLLASKRLKGEIMDQNDAVSVVEKLIETCRDGENGYRDAAEHIKRPDLKTWFLDQSRERAHFAMELQGQLEKLGKPEKKDSGSLSAALHRAWIDTKAGLGGGDKSILESVEQGEDSAKEAYEKAANASVPPTLAAIIRRQAQSVLAAHDKARNFRDQLAA
jgi:uncharacterized protein (TIGR02284 family)